MWISKFEQVVIIRSSDRRRDYVSRFQVPGILQVDHGIDFRRIGLGPGHHFARFTRRAVDNHVLHGANLRGGAIRVAPHLFVGQADIDRFFAALDRHHRP